VLYLRHGTHDASPIAISGRTSYLRVRLAYHPYPQLIPSFCNISGFGPPRGIIPASPWPWVAHPVSCLIPATRLSILNEVQALSSRPIQTRFRYGYGCRSLILATKINSQAHSPRGTPSGLAARFRISAAHRPTISPPTACKLTVSGSISLPSPGYFSPFPHGTCPLSVAKCI
jgi:hypothetical protein